MPRATKQVVPVPAGGTVAGLAGLLASLVPCSGHALGRQAEDVARYALWRAPTTRDGLVAVGRWADWVREWNIEHPDQPEQAADRGIDLVATYSDGRCTAVQVKLRTGGSPVGVGWEELATFAAKSATEPFTDRLLVLLGDAALSGNARAELARQHALKPLTVWAAAEIEAHTGTQWPADHAGLAAALGAAPPPPVEPRGLRGYQRDAVRDVHASFAGGADRAQLLMACGTGKTITTHGVAAQLPAGRLLVLAPSLSLLRQLIGAYQRQYGGRMDAIAVCSDATVGLAGQGEDLDEPVITAAELGVPTETEPAAIAAFLDAPPGDRPRVVFATYQSSPRVAEAQQLTAAAFDLVVADEAHYLAGRPSPAFATVLDGTRIRAGRRLFTTATPRLVAPHLRVTDPEVWASMDDPASFGPVAHRLPFGAAIGAGLLADYRLLVLGADELAAAAVNQRVLVDAGITTDARTLAAALAVLRLARDHGRRRIVTFHSRTAGARAFARLLEAHHKWAPPELRLDLAAEAVTGDQPSDVRAAALVRLDRAGQPGQPQVRVVTNARCLTAGVDVPALDAVVFVDPRRSRVDVVQAVGRVLRRAEGKDLGYVVVPVPVPDGTDAAAAVADSSFAPVWDVLAALTDHDDVLADRIEQARRAETDVPAGHTHADVTGGWLRPAVFGVMDGLVSNFALIAGMAGGVAGAGGENETVVLAGLAGLAAGAFSMAAGEYVSVASQSELARAELDVERRELSTNPEAEQEELAQRYVARGVDVPVAQEVARHLSRQPDQALVVHARDELGVDPGDLPSPFLAAGASFLAFVAGAALPLLPYLLGAASLLPALVVSAVGLFAVGALVSRVTARSWWWTGLRQLLIGGLAAALTYGFGTVVGTGLA